MDRFCGECGRPLPSAASAQADHQHAQSKSYTPPAAAQSPKSGLDQLTTYFDNILAPENRRKLIIIGAAIAFSCMCLFFMAAVAGSM
jgi:hypothetical protein